MSQTEMVQLIEALKRENEALKLKKTPSHGIKVSLKGAVSVYGLGRFPITLYASQWDKLLAKSEEIKTFIQSNSHQLSSKP